MHTGGQSIVLIRRLLGNPGIKIHNLNTAFARGSIPRARTWEHYLCFGEPRFSVKTIKLFMIHLANQDGLGDVVISPTLRYAILKITNNNMTAHKGVWNWIAEEVDYSKVKSILRLWL
jgi:hypothetical protein